MFTAKVGSKDSLNLTLIASGVVRFGRATVKRTELLGPACCNHQEKSSAVCISSSFTFRITSPARNAAKAAGLPGAIHVRSIPRWSSAKVVALSTCHPRFTNWSISSFATGSPVTPSHGFGTLDCCVSTRFAASRIRAVGKMLASEPSMPSTIPTVSPASFIATPPMFAGDNRAKRALNFETAPDGARETIDIVPGVSPMRT